MSRTGDVSGRRSPVTPSGLSLLRRRQLLAALLAAVCATLLAAVADPGTLIWRVQMAADIVLIGYVALLMHVRNVTAGVEMSAQALGTLE